MKIYNLIKNTVLTAIVASGVLSCEEATFPEALTLEEDSGKRTEAYYENLRAYKKSKHQISFGWYGPSGKSNLSATMQDRWLGLPDSLDLVSTWGGFPKVGSPAYKEMKFVQEVKGIKVSMVSFSNESFLKHYGGKDFNEKFAAGDEAKLVEGLDIIAKKVNDTIQKYGLDGVDFDHEPSFFPKNWGILKDSHKFGLFIKSLSKYFGPQSGTDKLLIIDGEISKIPTEVGLFISYAISQSYGTSTGLSLTSRYNQISSWCPPEKFIITENFESSSSTGGVDFKDPINGVIPSIWGMAFWNPKEGIKGGAGAYRIESDYANSPSYKYLRKMIQIMNPAP